MIARLGGFVSLWLKGACIGSVWHDNLAVNRLHRKEVKTMAEDPQTVVGEEERKAELLKRYERNPVTSYVQLDGRKVIWGGNREELMQFNGDVCVLVTETATAKDTARRLRKMAKLAEDGVLDSVRQSGMPGWMFELQ
jgi:hypothetical protein